MARPLVAHQSRRTRAAVRCDVRAEVLFDEDHPGCAGLCGDAERQGAGPVRRLVRRSPKGGGGSLGEGGDGGQEAGSAAGATGTSKENVEAGMASMSKKFLDMGAQVYVDKAEAVKESNKAL